MTLPLLNTILALDTKHSRPESVLHAPRERKKRNIRATEFNQIFSFGQPRSKSRKKNGGKKLSPSSLNRDTQTNQTFKLVPVSMVSPPNGQIPPQMHFAGQMPVASPYSMFTPMTPYTPVFGTSHFYQNFGQKTPQMAMMPQQFMQQQQQQQQFFKPMLQQQTTIPNPFAVPAPIKAESSRQSDTFMINIGENNEMIPVHTNSSRLFKPLVNSAEDNEDLTIRIKANLLRSIEEAQNYRTINQVTDSDKFLMAIDGVESTKDFYSKSKFMKNSDSVSPVLADNQIKKSPNDSTEGDDVDMNLIAPPVVF